MKLEAIPKDGTTLTRKAFWDKVTEVVNSSQKKEGKNVSVDVRDGYGTVINVSRERGEAALNCPTGDSVTVIFSGIESCGCIDQGSQSTLGTDLGSLNNTYVLPRISSTEFALTVPALFNYKLWNNNDCSGSPDIDQNNDTIVYARCIEASGMWTVSIQDTVSFFFAFFAHVASTTLSNESTCDPFLFTDLFHNGTATVSF